MNRVFKRLEINNILIGIIGISFAVSFISLPLMLADYWYSEYFYDWKEGIPTYTHGVVCRKSILGMVL